MLLTNYDPFDILQNEVMSVSELHERVRMVREHSKLSLAKFGDRLGVSKSVIANLEYNKVQPPEPMIRAIAFEFGVNHEWLKTGKGSMAVTAEESDVAALTNIMTDDDEFAKSLFRSFARLGPAEWRMLREFMEGVLRDTNENEQKK